MYEPLPTLFQEPARYFCYSSSNIVRKSDTIILTSINTTSMATPSTIVLVTGANKGIDLEISRQLASEPYKYHVLMASRDLTRGTTAASTLQEQGLSVKHISLDVTNDESIAAAVKLIDVKYDHIDVLINNAGTFTELASPLGGSPRQAWKDAFDTNVFGAAAVTDAFIPLLKKSTNPAPRMVFVSSDLGRLVTKYDPQHEYFKRPLPVYRCTKAAMNMLALYFAADFRAGWGAGEDGTGGGVEWKINVTCPGPTKTDFNRNRAQRPVSEGAKNAVRLAVLGPDGETGTISGNEGVLSW
jgi:NAD(P)-dependent dehydrogenase (short-subunit alcohol dehydrogenase family)